MNPTPRLRFVERDTLISVGNGATYSQTVRVLQQWFAYDIEYPMTLGEWKDVPTEKETNV
jgi:hypothetical protein